MIDPTQIKAIKDATDADLKRASFTPGEAPGAMPNGTRVQKVARELGDKHAIGDKATVIASIKIPRAAARQIKAEYFYYVIWDDMPGIPVLILSKFIGEAAP